MKLNAQYDLQDLIKLVEQDLLAKGFSLLSGAGTTRDEDFSISLLVERANSSPLSEPPAALPAPTEKKIKGSKTEEERRAYWRKQAQVKRERKATKAAGKPDQSNALKIVAQVNTPNLPHQHDITFYLVKGFSDPDDPNHKHYTRLCKDCGWNEVAECLTCKGRTDFQGKVLGTIEEIKKEKQEVVAPSPATFPSKETALAR